ncbi:MAG: rhodanese-like domain-containing protein [bacterium]
MSQTNTITPENFHALLESEPQTVLLDVRTRAEFRSVHATGAKNIPLETIVPTKLSLDTTLPQEVPICLLCEKGGRATVAAGHFLAAGFSNVLVVQGGTQAWIAAGLPVFKGESAVISIERQVRIGAGSLVLLGVILSIFVNPYFIILPIFVGAGLIFAGVTDWCGMGLLLARAPWNR